MEISRVQIPIHSSKAAQPQDAGKKDWLVSWALSHKQWSVLNWRRGECNDVAMRSDYKGEACRLEWELGSDFPSAHMSEGGWLR